ncbi:MAG TPA: hypothetical protein VFO21_17885 [Vicinamibacterales bacterium]|nr:hypothetical protein [Vicinamibacterales bacterium]
MLHAPWRCSASIAAVLIVTAIAGAAPQNPGVATYRDPQGRFTFEYPVSFGTPGRGTDDGFGDRVAAVRFSNLTGLGGEAVLTTGPIAVDVQALGGLYDPIALQVFPDAIKAQVVSARPAVTRAGFCQLLGAADHLGAAGGLPERVREAARNVDRMRNIDPRVVRCQMAGNTVTFYKEATFTSGAVSARQHIFGALRFLDAPFSAFQIVRAALAPPTDEDLDVLARIVRSFSATRRP